MPVDPLTGLEMPAELHPLAQALIDAHATIAPKIAEANTAHTVNLLEGFERDVGPLVAPIAQQLLDDPNTPPELHGFLTVLAGPTHFGESVVIGIAIGSILSPVLGAAFAPLVQGVANTAWPKLANAPLSPELLAAAVLKGVLTEGAAASQATTTGYNATSFHTMVEVAGQSIGLAEALLLYRRGQIDAARLQKVMQYSNLNPLFYDLVPMLRYAPPTAGEAIAGALKGHLTHADASQKLSEAGVDPVNFDWLLATAGRPISPLEAVHLWNRGEISEARVDQVIAQSDINPDFGPEVKLLRVYYPPVRSIVPMLRSGGITETKARDLLAKQGVQPDIIDAFVKEATASKASAGKDLTQAQVLRLYDHKHLTRSEATARLTALGLAADEIALLLDYTDGLQGERLDAALIAKIGQLYVAHKIDKTEATAHLGNGSIPAATQHDYFAVWDIERNANLHNLTPASIVGAYRRGYIGAGACKTRLTQAGVDPADLGIVVADGWPPTKGAEARAAADAVVNA